MPINRAPFNALVDDAGTGLTGSIWNKAAIAGVILDPVDAAIGTWTTVPFNVANFWTGVTAGMVAVNRYIVINKTLIWIVNVASAPSPPSSSYCPFVLPAGLTLASASCFSPIGYCMENGVAIFGQVIQVGTDTFLSARKVAGGAWAGTLTLQFTAIATLA